MRTKTVAILAVGVFLLGGACGALYAVLGSKTPASSDKLPFSSYDELENQDQSNNDNQDNQDNSADNNNTNDNSNNSSDNQQNNDNSAVNTNNGSNSSTNVNNTAENKTGEVTVREDSALTLRQGPGTNYEKVGQAYRGDRVDVLEEQNGWYKVKTYDGKEAWASSSYISIVE